MTPLLVFALAVLVSETMALGTWRLGNHDKPWGAWFKWGVPHFLSNLGIVMVVAFLWYDQHLDDCMAWGLSWVGASTAMQWDKLLPYNVTTGFILGIAADMSGDKIGYAFKLILPTLSGKLGALGGMLKPPPAAPPAATPPPAEGMP